MAPWGLLAAPLLWFLVEAWPKRPALDDAYISFRYARNLASGHGLVYNVGERVEGITNLLWTLLLAGGARLGVSPPDLAHVFDLTAGTCALLASFAFARALLPSNRAWLAALAPALLLVGPSFTYWSTMGLGTTLFVALVTATFAAQASGRMGWALLLACLSTLARPEGGLTAAIVLGADTLAKRREGWKALRLPVAYAVFLLTLTGFRLAYFGSPVPNTFYAKVGDIPMGRGWYELRRFLAAGAAPLLPLAVPALIRERRSWPAALLFVATGAYVVWIGGDVFPYFRFMLAPLALLVGLAVVGAVLASTWRPPLRTLAVAWRPLLGTLVAAAVALATVNWLFRSPTGVFRVSLPTDRRISLHNGWYGNCRFHNAAANIAYDLRDRAERGEHIDLALVSAIGAFGYYNGSLRIVDAFGLTDPHVARERKPLPKGAARIPGHTRSNADYVMSLKPDYVLIQPPDDGKTQFFASSIEIGRHPEFQNYEKVRRWGLYRRKDLPPPKRPERLAWKNRVPRAECGTLLDEK